MQQLIRPSYWESTTFLRPAQVIIIGGGFTGLQTALAIKAKRPGWDVVVIERSAFGRGASTRNAGFACFGAPTELLEDAALHGWDNTWATVEARYQGIVSLARQYSQYCNYQQLGGYEVFQDEAIFQEVMAALPMINEGFARITGQPEVWKFRSNLPGIRAGVGVVYNQLEGQLHPGKLVAHLINQCQTNGVRLLFGTEVIALMDDSKTPGVKLANGNCIRGDQLVLTTNAFSGDLVANLPVQPARNQVFISKPIPNLQLRGCYHHERGYVYFRNVGPDRILIGGARHLAGGKSETTTFGNNPMITSQLLTYLENFVQLPDNQVIEIDQSWSGIIAQGGKSPIVERQSNGWVFALRMSGMGVALSAQVAQRAATLVCEE